MCMIQKEYPFLTLLLFLFVPLGHFLQKGEAVQVGLDSIKSSIDIFNKCNGPNGCEPKEAADAVFAILGGIGFVVGVFCPPAGAVIAVMAAVGSFVASFLGDKPVRAMPGLDAAAVEAAAFRAVKKVEDTGTFAEFADFASVLRTATEFNSNTLLDLQKVNCTRYNQTGSKDAQEAVDKIIDVWFDQYHQYKWVDLLSRMKDSGKAYVSAFGDITGSRRGVFADWAKDSKKTCKLEYYLEMNQKGRDNLNTCKVSTMPSIKQEPGLHIEEFVLTQSLPFSNSNSTI